MSLEITEELIARQSPEAQVIIRLLLAQIDQLRGEIAELKKTSRNSSLPPATQHPHAKPPAAKPRSKNTPRGQPGHPRHERALLPTADCTALVILTPDHCRRCQTPLSGNDPAPLRHQVWDLPEIKPLVTEDQQHRRTCSRCGETTCAGLPEGVPTG